ncbi:hemopexin repeat-containing protein [Cecembia rubra]|uniref:hemopexin repeat-containing protein n=1 Tax=Cecembia rubra TaxID=1485585 RepID=UPI0027148659|nr:hemopexin repeat-containing protein [Cecembia rubra]
MQKNENLSELVVIFKEDAQMKATARLFSSGKGLSVKQLNANVKKASSRIEQVFSAKTNFEVLAPGILKQLKKEGIHSDSYFSLYGEGDLDVLREEILKDPLVEAAYIKPPAEDPNASWKTTNFEGNQGYLDVAPGGIDAKFSWKLVGGNGQHVKVVDVEQGFNLTHEDLRHNISSIIAGNNTRTSMDHGTAVLGVLGAGQNEFGMTGISPKTKLMAISHNGLGTSKAIIEAANKLSAGDVILLEVHRAGPAYDFKTVDGQRGYIAIEWWPDDFAAIKYAVAKGILVVEAAGNGKEDFDKEIYNKRPSGFPSSWKNPFNPSNPQSGAIIVGAGGSAGNTLDRKILGFSNWGRRVDAQGWGHNVATCGYAGLQGDMMVKVNPNDSWKVEAGYPKNLSELKVNLPMSFPPPGATRSMAHGADAMLWSNTNEKVYVFLGHRYLRLDPKNGYSADPGYPKDIDGNWPGFPANFKNGVDAALWSHTNQKIYFFKGDSFIRVDPNNSWKVDGGYPKKIAGNWPGFPASFAKGVDAALYSFKTSKIYFFKGSQYLRVDPNNGWKVDAGYPKAIAGNWQGFPATFQKGVDAAFYDRINDRVYIVKSKDLWYTGGFNGTSSASPVVTGALINLQSRMIARGKPKLTAVTARNVLRNTGTRQLRYSGQNEVDAISNWRGLDADFGSGINAALWNGKSDRIYFFKGNQYVRVDPKNNWNIDPTYPKPIKGNWPGWPASFESGIDAALWSKPNNKVYIFKGNQFLRIDPNNSWKVDSGYPKSIAGSWTGFPSDFANGVDAALWSDTTNRIYFFKGDKFIRVNPSDGWKVESGYPKTVASSWPNTPAGFTSNIDAALWSGTNKKIYFFKGENYTRVDPLNGWAVEAGYPKLIASQRIGRRPDLKAAMANLQIDSNWPGIPASFGSNLDAGLWSDTNKKVYLFKGSQFIRIDPFNNWEMDAGYPKPIAGNWPGFPSAFATGIDAALWSDTNKRIYFFKGNQFIRVNPAAGWQVEAGYPKPISGNWPGFPTSFASGVDAALWSGTNKRIYFFKGNQYIRVNPANAWQVEAGYPKVISNNWKGLPSNFKAGINASLWNGKSSAVYFFKGSQYVKINTSNWTVESGYPYGIIS